jgi:hypothetical protein
MASDADDATIDAAVGTYVANDAAENLSTRSVHVARDPPEFLNVRLFRPLYYDRASDADATINITIKARVANNVPEQLPNRKIPERYMMDPPGRREGSGPKLTDYHYSA